MMREVVRAFLSHSLALGEIPPEYETCPRICASGFKTNECDSCPVKTENEFFKDNLIENLDKNPDCKNWKNYGVNSLLQTVIDVMDTERFSQPANLTAKTDALVGILVSERNRLERVERENSRTENK